MSSRKTTFATMTHLLSYCYTAFANHHNRYSKAAAKISYFYLTAKFFSQTVRKIALFMPLTNYHFVALHAVVFLNAY